jgi:hypothetical protein
MITPINTSNTPINKAIVDDTQYRLYRFIRFNSFKVENNLNVIYRIDSMILNSMWDILRVHVAQIHWDGMIIKIKK